MDNVPLRFPFRLEAVHEYGTGKGRAASHVIIISEGFFKREDPRHSALPRIQKSAAGSPPFKAKK
jgi:hypothetical protein